MKYNNIIGIDISKENFTVALYGDKIVRSYDNNRKGYKAFCEGYKKLLAECLVVMESTGGYEEGLASYLNQVLGCCSYCSW